MKIGKLVIAQDKANHFVWAAVLTSLFLSLLKALKLNGVYFSADPIVVKQVTAGVVILIAAAKEVIHDYYMMRGSPSWADFWWSVGGVLAVAGNW